MIKAIIIDDEPKSVFTLRSFLEQHCQELTVAGSADNAKSGKALIETVKPQLVFLDIEMPMGSGFDLLNSLPSIEFEIIFITAYNQYAINAFRFSALDYLLKPLRISQLMEAVDKATARIKDKTKTRNYDLLLRNMNEQNSAKQKLAFTEKGEQFLVPMDDIMYLVAEGNYTSVHTPEKTFMSTKNLKDFEDILPLDLFCRIHHGHMVNLQFIAKMQKARGGVVTMKDGKTLEISIRRKEAFMKMYYPM
jgi:two-component system, LytTR family, response regulator